MIFRRPIILYTSVNPKGPSDPSSRQKPALVPSLSSSAWRQGKFRGFRLLTSLRNSTFRRAGGRQRQVYFSLHALSVCPSAGSSPEVSTCEPPETAFLPRRGNAPRGEGILGVRRNRAHRTGGQKGWKGIDNIPKNAQQNWEQKWGENPNQSSSEAEHCSRFPSVRSPGDHLPPGENILLISFLNFNCHLPPGMQTSLKTISHRRLLSHPSISLPLVHFIALGEL